MSEILEIEKNIETVNKIVDENIDYNNLTKKDIINLAYKTDIGKDVKQFYREFLYQLGNNKDCPERNICLNIEINHNEGNRVIFGKVKFLREDFLTIFNLFDTLIEDFCHKLQNDFKGEKEQLGMFNDNVDSVVISEVKANINVFNYASESMITMPVIIQLLNNDFYCIKIGKESFSKVDLYIIYLKFNEIVNLD